MKSKKHFIILFLICFWCLFLSTQSALATGSNQVSVQAKVLPANPSFTKNDFNLSSIGQNKLVLGESTILEKKSEKIPWFLYILIFSPIIPFFLLLFVHWQIQKNQD